MKMHGRVAHGHAIRTRFSDLPTLSRRASDWIHADIRRRFRRQRSRSKEQSSASNFTFGADDVIVVAEAPDNVAAAAVSVLASSGLVRTRVALLLTVEEMDAALARPSKYRALGAEKEPPVPTSWCHIMDDYCVILTQPLPAPQCGRRVCTCVSIGVAWRLAPNNWRSSAASRP